MRTITLVSIVLAVALTASAQVKSSEDRAIDYVKQLSVTRLDSTLRRARFVDWLTKLAGPSAILKWEVNDCGEQTGNPAVDTLRDIPTCVGVTVDFADHRKIEISIAVGSALKGLYGPPELYDVILEASGTVKSFRSLHSLADAVGAFRKE
jgi:hypothetical protein